MQSFIVRKAENRDIPHIQTLMVSYITDFYGAAHPGEDKLGRLIAELQQEKEGMQLVVEADGRLVGFATLYFSYSTLRAAPIAVMNDLFMLEKARGSGAATALFEACKQASVDRGCACMSWETAQDNERAQRFYAKMGGEKGSWLTYSITL